MVGSSNPGESMSFLPGRRLDLNLPILFDRLTARRKKNLNNQLHVAPSNNIFLCICMLTMLPYFGGQAGLLFCHSFLSHHLLEYESSLWSTFKVSSVVWTKQVLTLILIWTHSFSNMDTDSCGG